MVVHLLTDASPQVAADLSLLADTGHQLEILVFDKSFKEERGARDDLREDHTLPVSSRAIDQGHVAKRRDLLRSSGSIARWRTRPAAHWLEYCELYGQERIGKEVAMDRHGRLQECAQPYRYTCRSGPGVNETFGWHGESVVNCE